jgi:transcription elongation factor GreA
MAEKTADINLNDAAGRFIGSLPSEIATSYATEIRRFISWFHGDKLIKNLTPLEVAGYSDRFSSSDTESARKLEILRKFLAYVKKEGWTGSNLATNLKTRKEKTTGSHITHTTATDMGVLTQQGYDDARKQITELKGQRPRVLDDIRRAAADKDFRENAPLHAAREQLGHIDGRIKELEAIVKTATIIDQSERNRSRITIGDTVVLKAVATGIVQTYTIVGPKESDPSRGKISHVSPIGKAIIGRSQGETVEIEVPAGKILYCVEKIGGQSE